MRKILLTARNVFEIVVPITAFVIMFITFILQVFFRYVVNHPLTWTQEIIVVGFTWTVLFGACYTMRNRSHVKFTMIYDKLKPKKAALFRMLGNIIIAGTFITLIIPSYNYSLFVGYQKTGVIRISYTFIFLPFVYFVCSIVGYSISEIIEDIHVITGKIEDSKDHKNILEVLK
jgi:C4-dicarboxylate transporter, DctQ subunit